LPSRLGNSRVNHRVTSDLLRRRVRLGQA